jgi:hypothetical protein
VREAEATEVREQLLELLDERHEAGPTAYVVNRATVESDGGDWSLVLVFHPTEPEPAVGIRFSALATEPGGADVTPESLAWHVYNGLEAGRWAAAGTGPADASGVRWVQP